MNRVETKTPFFIFTKSENKQKGIHYGIGMVIPPGITISWTRNPLGITSKYRMNPPKEEDSALNYQLIYTDSGQQDQNARKIF
jgi:hypothetical protein